MLYKLHERALYDRAEKKVLEDNIRKTWSDVQPQLLESLTEKEKEKMSKKFIPFDLLFQMLEQLGKLDGKDILIADSSEIFLLLKTLKKHRKTNYRSIKLITNLESLRGKEGVEVVDFNKIPYINLNMKFDIVVGNPPFNISKGGKSGVAGNTKLWRAFTKFAYKHSKDLVCLIVPDNLTQLLRITGGRVHRVSFMTNVDYWKYRTLFFTGYISAEKNQLEIVDKVLDKVYTTATAGKWDIVKTEQTADTNGVEAIYAITKNDFLSKSKVNPSKVVSGPKLMYSTLVNRNIIVVTDELALPKFARVIKTKSLEEAEKLKLFMENNKIFDFVQLKMKARNCFDTVFLNFMKFDISQIETGFEYPKEWRLTSDEIKYIETVTK